jgi:hypothetical protein
MTHRVFANIVNILAGPIGRVRSANDQAKLLMARSDGPYKIENQCICAFKRVNSNWAAASSTKFSGQRTAAD